CHSLELPPEDRIGLAQLSLRPGVPHGVEIKAVLPDPVGVQPVHRGGRQAIEMGVQLQGALRPSLVAQDAVEDGRILVIDDVQEVVAEEDPDEHHPRLQALAEKVLERLAVLRRTVAAHGGVHLVVAPFLALCQEADERALVVDSVSQGDLIPQPEKGWPLVWSSRLLADAESLVIRVDGPSGIPGVDGGIDVGLAGVGGKRRVMPEDRKPGWRPRSDEPNGDLHQGQQQDNGGDGEDELEPPARMPRMLPGTGTNKLLKGKGLAHGLGDGGVATEPPLGDTAAERAVNILWTSSRGLKPWREVPGGMLPGASPRRPRSTSR